MLSKWILVGEKCFYFYVGAKPTRWWVTFETWNCLFRE